VERGVAVHVGLMLGKIEIIARLGGVLEMHGVDDTCCGKAIYQIYNASGVDARCRCI
jgi:hypothetical protein